MTEPTQVPEEAYGIFCGGLDQNATQRITHACAVGAGSGHRRVHLLFHSSGGVVGDGIYLYHLFQHLPFELIVYNSGHVASCATIAYLGAKTRYVSAYGAFMVHRTIYAANTGITAAQVQGRIQNLSVDDQRTEAILRKHLTLDGERWNDLDRNELWFSADEAVRIGLATAIAEFAPPAGTQLFYVI